MIIQIGALLGNAFSGLIQAATPLAVQTGQFFLQRELGRIQSRDAKKQVAARAVEALNTPGISVARIGGTTQPVGGAVQRSTFLPATNTPAQSPYGNVPLLPVTSAVRAPAYVPNDIRANPAARVLMGAPAPTPVPFVGPTNGGRMPLSLNGNGAGPKYAVGGDGKALKFWNSPIQQEGYLEVNQAKSIYGSKVKPPFYRFNRMTGGFEKIKARRMNPFNFRAAERARRRVSRTYDAIKDVMQINNAVEKGVRSCGKVVKFRTKKKRKRCS